MLETRVDASVQCMGVSTEDRAQFFKNMGHSEHVNVGTYQQLLPVLAMTKVGAVLANINASMAVQKCTKPQENAANTSLIDKLCFPNSLL